MPKIKWDQDGERKFEAGVDHGVLYPKNADGTYATGVAWNGLTGVNEAPSGGDDNEFYADNILYGSLRGAERFGATITAFTAPDEWNECDGSKEAATGLYLGQQNRRRFGFSYRTMLGNDAAGLDLGYKIHIIYNGSASPTDRDYSTINENPDMIELSWEMTTLPVALNTLDPSTGKPYKPTAHLIIDSTKFNTTALQEKLTAIENLLYGVDADAEHSITGSDPTLPSPDTIIGMITGQ